MNAATNQSRVRILLVEDNPGDARLLRELLFEDRRMQAELVHVDYLSKAFEALRSPGIDLVLLDLSLPDAQGLETLIRTHELAPAVPIVVLTGSNDEELALRAVQLGAQDYLVKDGIDGPSLGRSVRYAIERNKAEHMGRQLLAEQAARAQAEIEEARFRSLAQAVPQIVWEISSKGGFEYTNPRWLEYSGQTAAEARESAPRDWIHPDDLAQWLGGQAHRAEWELEFRLRDAGGNYRWHLARVAPLLEHGDGPVRWYVASTDIDDRKLAEEERARLYDAAQRAIKSRDDLLATVSHDLRSPLGSILFCAEELQAELPDIDAAVASKIAVVIRSSAKQMEVLIRDLLDIASIESGHLRIAAAAVPVADLLGEVVEALRPAAQARRVRLELDADNLEDVVACDKNRVHQIYTNLVGNALKFSSGKNLIVLRARRSGREVTFSVVDNGPGIAQDQLGRVFDRFWRADDKSLSGVGLGLAICRGIVEQHGGRIWVESKVGEGTTFSFTLPLATDKTPPRSLESRPPGPVVPRDRSP